MYVNNRYFSFSVPGDKSALNPSGIRFGTPPITTRGIKEGDMKNVVNLVHQGKKLFRLLHFKRKKCKNIHLQHSLWP